jgi:hypothetical protein
LWWKFSTTNLSKTRKLPKAFTEKGLYMVAAILKVNFDVLKFKYAIKKGKK